MFTVCPKCALTLAVTTADLRVAQGYVRCGRCLNVFNALARLSEERPAAAPLPPDTAPAGLPEQPAAPAQPSAPPEPSSQIEDTAEDTGEIDVELDASFLATSTSVPAPERTAEALEAAQPSEAQSLAAEPASAPSPAGPGSPPSAAGSGPAESMVEEKAPAHAVAEAASGEPDESPAGEQAAPQPRPEPSSSPAAADAKQTNTAQQPPENFFELRPRRPRAGLAWTLGAGALAIALALQVVNHYRDALAGNPALSGPLSTVYSALGVKLAPRWNIHAYDVRQLGASVAGTAAGEIVVRASVKNSASRAQPLPLLRVTLQDRFGNRIAARDVPPRDYLPSPVAAGSLLAAGSRVDATMVFVDPGPQAAGFEIDACLPQRNGAVACAHGP